jgi:hypothetical protein
MASNLKVVMIELEAFTAKQAKQLTLEVTANLRETTPRDTSWAASNWIPNIGTPIRETDGSRTGVSSARSEAGLAQVATKYRLVDEPIFISNNVPYIQKLNNGHSKQAPAGFVQIARDRALNKVNR